MSHAIAIRIKKPYFLIKPLNLDWNFNRKILLVAFSVLVLSLLSVYIFQVNKLTSDNYSLDRQEKTLSALSQENRTLEISSNQMHSLENIGALAANFGFEKINDIHYIKVLGSSVAAK